MGGSTLVSYPGVCMHVSLPVVVANLTSLSEIVDEGDGAVEVCVQLNHRPIDIIITATLTTQSLTATGIRNSHSTSTSDTLT